VRVKFHKCSLNTIRNPNKKNVISCYELLSNPKYTTNLPCYMVLENECTVLRRRSGEKVETVLCKLFIQ
jgi:hypothetical protein